MTANKKGVRPEELCDKRWSSMHERYKKEANECTNCDILLIGDSIVQQFKLTKFYNECIPKGLSVLNFGIGGDKVENVMWRIEDGDWFDNLKPKIVVLFVGTNNINSSPKEVVDGIESIIMFIREKVTCHIVLPYLLPKGHSPNKYRAQNKEINELLKTTFENQKDVHFVDMDRNKIIDKKGEISHLLMHDYLHLTEAGYRMTWSVTIEKCLQLLKQNK